jgi:hypothetical protein
MARGDDGYDKPKKSWAEIDKARDGKRSGGARVDRDQRQFEQSKQYSRYKSAADKFFAGDAMPEAFAERMDPTGEGRARKEALAKLRNAEEFREFATLARDYADKYGMPADPYVLDRLLGHPNEGLVLKTLEEIVRLLDAGEFKVPKSLPERLKSLELGSDSPELQDAARALSVRLRQ